MELAAPQISELMTSEYDAYFQPMFDLVGDGDVHSLLQEQKQELLGFYGELPDRMINSIQPPFTWSIKQVLGHLIDTEKVFGYRAHRIAAGDPTDLPGFDHELLARCHHNQQVSQQLLMEEFEALRTTNQRMFSRLSSEQWSRKGHCDQKQISVRAIAFLMIGHVKHHLGILNQRLQTFEVS